MIRGNNALPYGTSSWVSITVFQNAIVEEEKKQLQENRKRKELEMTGGTMRKRNCGYYTCRLVTAMSTTAVSLLLTPCAADGAVSHRPVAEHVVLTYVAFDGPCSASGMDPAWALTQSCPKPKRVNDDSARSWPCCVGAVYRL
jgi:hypothetical protein